MATNDLMAELQKDSIKLDDDSERKVHCYTYCQIRTEDGYNRVSVSLCGHVCVRACTCVCVSACECVRECVYVCTCALAG